MWKLLRAVSLILCAAAGAEAQGVVEPSCGAAGGGAIRGVVVDDSTGVPISGGYVYLFVQGNCRSTTDALGRFVVQDVPAGVQRIEAGSVGYRQFRPITVDVIRGDTVGIELRLIPGGELQDCRAVPSCAPLTEGGFDTIRDSEVEFQVVALGTAIGLAWATVGGDERWYACLPREPGAVFSALSQRYAPLADTVACEVPRDASGSLARQMRHMETDLPAFRPRIDRVSDVTPRRRTVSLSYYIGPRWAAGWDCDFELGERGWRPTICIARWVS